jgi:hypothetical protein
MANYLNTGTAGDILTGASPSDQLTDELTDVIDPSPGEPTPEVPAPLGLIMRLRLHS